MSDQVRALGIDLIEGYGADQLAFNPDVYVVGNVLSRAHLADGTPKYPLMEAILNAGLPYTSGPQWLAEHVLQGRHVLAVAGTHGKTTTTAMLTWILECAGLQPGFLIGGVPLNFGVSARLGRDSSASPPFKQGPRDGLGQPADAAAPSGGSVHRQWESVGATFVIEADEYDTAFFDKRSKFVHYRPRTVILNNLEFDHADIFHDLAAIERQFHHLVRTVPSSGRVVVNATEESLERVIAGGCWSEQVLFGKASLNKAGFTAQGEPDSFEVLKAGQSVGKVQWAVSGVHNQLNALAAIAAAEHVGVSPAAAAEALASFQNVKRRMELKGVINKNGGSITVYDDFAHHPTAIHTTIDGLRRQLDAAGKAADRILAVFEPRSNTMKLGAMTAQLPRALEAADIAFCHAGELDWDAAEALAPMVDRAQVADNIEQLVKQVKAAAKPGDHVLCMSNGGFGGIHGKLLAALAA
jgi:UDP-N-acetylmuramate: L-alanyl-gamma-D-glutamyl-meso-diaminopimelate ligase